MSSVTYRSPRQTAVLPQMVAALAVGIALFLMLMSAWTAGYQLFYAGRIFPGVSVAGVDISGMRPADAAVKLSQTLSYPYSGRVLLTDNGQMWVATPAELGMVFDASASAQSAFQIGRGGGLFGSLSAQIGARRHGIDISPVIVLDERVAYSYLQNIAGEIDQPMVEASLSLQGTNVVANPGQVGRLLDVDATLAALSSQLRSFRDGEVKLVIAEKQPEIMDVSAQADLARRILSEPLRLTLPQEAASDGDVGPWVYDPQIVAKLLTVQKVQNDSGTQVQILLSPPGLREILSSIALEADQKPQNARFVFNDETRQLDLIQSSQIGRVVDPDSSITAINEAIQRAEHVIPISMVFENPQVSDTATAADLGITENVSTQTSYFYGSSAERIQNIQTAAARYHGLLIAPGETFSMGEALGDVSLDNGFAEALIIYGGRTIKGVGGGVCQVSTTLFRTVLYGGYPVVERHSHAYRVSYYEMTAGGSRDPNWVGLDATVYFPLVDFKFTNDTPYWILMETYVNPEYRTLTWKFYSTSDGRTVQLTNSGPRNVVPAPKPVIQENSDFKAGQIEQVDWAAEGADVDVVRTVNRDGQVYFQDEFKTHYEPWQAVCEYGPGTKDPEKLAKRKGLCQVSK
jgi:vancomycin resistance protein YoaR